MNHILCGLRLASDIPLPELPPGNEEDGTPEIEVRQGWVPEHLPDSVHEGPILQVGADGTCRYEVTGVAAYLVEEGCRITVQSHMEADAPDIRLFLLGSVFGLLCYQRGWLPLHACCMEIGGRAIAISAESGIGKSTLAATFVRHGYRILADDVSVIDAHAPGGPLVIPAIPRIRLWRDVLETFGLAAGELEPCRNRMEKFQLPLPGLFQPDPLPLAAVYHLGRVAEERHAGLSRLTGMAAADALLLSVYRRQAGNRMGKGGQILRAVHRLMQLPCLSLCRVHGLDRLDETVALLVSRHEGKGAAG